MKRETRAEASDEGLLRITPGGSGQAVVLAAAGEVDLLTGPRLRAALAELLERADPAPVVIDLTEVTFLGSTGIAVLADAHWEARQMRIPLAMVVSPDSPAHRALHAAGLEQHFPLYFDLNVAMRQVCDG